MFSCGIPVLTYHSKKSISLSHRIYILYLSKPRLSKKPNDIPMIFIGFLLFFTRNDSPISMGLVNLLTPTPSNLLENKIIACLHISLNISLRIGYEINKYVLIDT